MNTYTLHLPVDARPGEAGALDQAVLVRDGFAWGAFLFTALWFFAQRLWLAGLLVLAAVVGLAALLAALGVGPGATFLAELLLGILIGLEANTLKRWTLRRRKPAVDVVAAASRDEAEVKSFGRWLARAATPPMPAMPTARPAPGLSPAQPLAGLPQASVRRPEPVIGLFPEAERRRP